MLSVLEDYHRSQFQHVFLFLRVLRKDTLGYKDYTMSIINELIFIWIIGGKTLRGEDGSIWRKISPRATLCTECTGI
jgi:hypothetical protein